jgi:hypothetical protein
MGLSGILFTEENQTKLDLKKYLKLGLYFQNFLQEKLKCINQGVNS